MFNFANFLHLHVKTCLSVIFISVLNSEVFKAYKSIYMAYIWIVKNNSKHKQRGNPPTKRTNCPSVFAFQFGQSLQSLFFWPSPPPLPQPSPPLFFRLYSISAWIVVPAALLSTSLVPTALPLGSCADTLLFLTPEMGLAFTISRVLFQTFSFDQLPPSS